MKRRDFISRTFVIGLALGLMKKTGSLLPSALAGGVIWAIEGKLGYKSQAPETSLKINKKCSTCGWYKASTLEAGAGICNFSGIQKIAGGGPGKDVFVKDNGICTMWKRKA